MFDVKNKPTFSETDKKREAVFNACQKILIDTFNGAPDGHSSVCRVTQWLIFWAMTRGTQVSFAEAEANLSGLSEWLRYMFVKHLEKKDTRMH